MRIKKSTVILCLFGPVILFQFCSKKNDVTVTTDPTVVRPTLPATPFNYSNITYPAHIADYLPTVDNTPAGNPITDDGATLGRVLFYDQQLSKNNKISCGSCHRQDLSFNDTAIKSPGFAGGLTTRHSMPLLNVRFYKSGKMFWDERAATLEQQVLLPIQDHVEMGLTLTELETKVAALDYYPSLFQKAFGSSAVSADKISRALSQFIRSIVTYQSKYDRVKQGLETFTADERDGETVFFATAPGPAAVSCAGCHSAPMFLTSQPVAPFALPDPADRGINNQNRFKSGSLRNIALTAPYFHNGSVSTLQNMLGLTPGVAPVPAHTVAPPDRIKLLAFLQTLTDQNILTDPKLSDPFK
jgi:cytochrome c peroxidase